MHSPDPASAIAPGLLQDAHCMCVRFFFQFTTIKMHWTLITNSYFEPFKLCRSVSLCNSVYLNYPVAHHTVVCVSQLSTFLTELVVFKRYERLHFLISVKKIENCILSQQTLCWVKTAILCYFHQQPIREQWSPGCHQILLLSLPPNRRSRWISPQLDKQSVCGVFR